MRSLVRLNGLGPDGFPPYAQRTAAAFERGEPINNPNEPAEELSGFCIRQGGGGISLWI